MMIVFIGAERVLLLTSSRRLSQDPVATVQELALPLAQSGRFITLNVLAAKLKINDGFVFGIALNLALNFEI